MGQTGTRRRRRPRDRAGHHRRTGDGRRGSAGARVRATAAGQDPFWRLIAIAKRLQEPDGCPWDRAQTVTSLFPHLIEEVWEAFAALEAGHRNDLQDELGDVLYTTLFLALLAEREGWFTLDQLLTASHSKMVRRHPHVFGAATAATADQAYGHWKRIKQQEGGRPRRIAPKRLRPLMVALWTRLLTDRKAIGRLEAALAERSVSGTRTRPSATPRRAPGR